MVTCYIQQRWELNIKPNPQASNWQRKGNPEIEPHTQGKPATLSGLEPHVFSLILGDLRFVILQSEQE